MAFNLGLIFTIVRREVKDQFRDWRITLPIIFLTAVFPFIVGYVSDQLVNFVQTYDAEIIAENMIPFFLLVVGFFPITISLVIATESFVGEKERRTIEPLLSSPLKDWELYLGKMISVMFPPLFGSFIGMGVYLLGVFIDFGFITKIAMLVLVVALTIVQALVMVSAAVVISTQATTVRSANLLSSFIVVPMAFLIQWEAIVMFWGDYRDLWWVVVGLFILSVLFVRVGITHFNREELLGQEFDALNFRWMLSVFRERFVGSADSFVNWYRFEIPKTIHQLRMPIIIMVGLFGLAWLFGIELAEIFVVNPDWIQLEDGTLDLPQSLGLMSMVSGKTALYFWFQNLRAMFLGSILGLFTFGILGVLVMLLPFAIVSYFMVPLDIVGVPAWKYLLATVLPHGIFEIPAILLLGAAILRTGARLASPSRGESISDGLIRSLADWAKIVVGLVIPLMLGAALLEAFVTPRAAIWLLT